MVLPCSGRIPGSSLCSGVNIIVSYGLSSQFMSFMVASRWVRAGVRLALRG